MCCCCGWRLSTICASIFTLVQSLIGIALSVFVVVNYNVCISWVPTNIFTMTYFYSPQCLPYEIVFTLVDRTYKWGIAYLALNFLWLITSILMAVASGTQNTTKLAAYFMYIPWIIVTTAIATADLAAAIIYFYDLNYVQFDLQLTSDNWISVGGPIVMGLLFSRLIIGWIINVAMLFSIIVALVRLWKRADDPKIILQTVPHGRQVDNGLLPGAPPIEEPAWNDGYLPRVVEHARPSRQVDRDYADKAYYNTRPTGRDDLHEDTSSHQHYMGPNVREIVSQQPKMIVPDPRHRDRADNFSDRRKGYIPSGPSSLQYENDELNGDPAEGKPRYGTGVRSQLPWSYFQNPDDRPHHVRKQPDVKDDDVVRPPVPVPDYTLHIGKRPKNGSHEVSRSASIASSSNSSTPMQGQDKDQLPGGLSRSSRDEDVLY